MANALKVPNKEVLNLIKAFGIDPNPLQSFTLKIVADDIVIVETTQIVQLGQMTEAKKAIVPLFEKNQHTKKTYMLVEFNETELKEIEKIETNGA